MKRLALLFCGSVVVALAAGCSSKGDNAGPAQEDDIVCGAKETKDESGSCVAAKKPVAKKDGGTTPGPTTPPAPPPAPTPDAGPAQDSGAPSPHPTNPRDICVDTANTVAFAAQRCGELFADAFQSFVNAAAGGDCRNIKSIRDVNALYTQCLPWIQKAKCEDLRSGSLPETCLGQLLP